MDVNCKITIKSGSIQVWNAHVSWCIQIPVSEIYIFSFHLKCITLWKWMDFFIHKTDYIHQVFLFLYWSVSCVLIIKWPIGAINITNQLKLTQTLECLLKLWKGFFERMKSNTTEAEVRQLSKPVLTFQTPAYDVFSILLLLIQQESLSVWLRITYSILAATRCMSFSLRISIFCLAERSLSV